MQKKINKTRNLFFTQRITEAMNRIIQYPLTIVEAPMGYGKTTAVREYLNESGLTILWQRVFDSSTNSFWKGFCRSIAQLDDGRSQNLLQMGLPDDCVMIQEALNIIEEIEIAEKVVFVIDDYHLVSCKFVNCFVDALVKTEVYNLHIVLTARYTEFENLDELKLKGYVQHITMETLEFTPVEISKYYKNCGISITEIDAENLYSHTDGWISALYLIMIRFLQEGSFSNSSDIYKLIEKAIFAPFSEEIKDFLIFMCIFDRFSLEQASFMWNNENCETILSEIIRMNAFVKYDNRTKNYYIHSIFTNFLKDLLETKSLKKELYERAAQWFLKIGEYKEAMNYFYLCKDFDSLLFAMEEEKIKGKYVENDKELLIKYMEECPDSIKSKHHLALLMYGIRLISFREVALFGKNCAKLLNNIQSDKSLSDELKNQYLGEYELLISFTEYNDITKMVKHIKKADEFLSKPSILFDSKAIGTTFGSPSVLYMFYREIGKLEEHVKNLLEAFPNFHKATNGSASGQEYIMESEWYYNKGDFASVENSIQKALDEARIYFQIEIIICATFLEIRVALIKGDFSRILQLFKDMHDNIKDKRAYFLLHTIEICEGFIYSLLKQTDKVPTWIVEGDFKSKHIMFPTIPMANIVYGRVLLLKGEYFKLIGCGEYFIEVASVFPNLLAQVYTYIYIAAANKEIARNEEALVGLKKALNIAIPDNVYMPFVENCEYIKPLLEEIKDQGIFKADILKILELYVSYEEAVKKIKREHFSKSKPMLTEREIEVSRCAANGMTNKEIGEKLFVSPNTVKTALKSVYTKLSINNRALLAQYFEEES